MWGEEMGIGENIRYYRGKAAMTLEELSKLVGVSRQTLSRYETGIIGNIPSDKIEALAYALQTTPAALMGWDDMALTISDTDPQIDRILDSAKELNAQGLEKLGTYAEDLAGNPAYRKEKK